MNISALNLLSTIVDDILSFKKKNRTHNVESRLAEMISEAETSFRNEDTLIKKEAMYWVLLGRVYSCSTNYSQKAIQALKTACELDPKLIDAWNELGEIYWSCLEVDSSKQCFDKALELSVNKVSLRNLSVVTRKQAQNMKTIDRTTVYGSALLLAKRALDLDPTDGESWSTLGNSYLAAYFNSPLERQYILQALTCFSQAEKNLACEDKLDVYYNKGVVLKHLEYYSSALDYFLKCIKGDETWKLPLKMYHSLLHYLDIIKENIVTKGKLEPIRYKKLLKDLGDTMNHHPNIERKGHSRDVGDVRYLCGKVLWTVEVDDSFPVTIGLLDSNEAVKVVTIFNSSIPRKFLKSGDSLVICNPQLEEIEFLHKEKYKFSKVRVIDPTTIKVNSKNLPKFCYVKYNFETSPI